MEEGARTGLAGKTAPVSNVASALAGGLRASAIALIDAKDAPSPDKVMPKALPSRSSTRAPVVDFAVLMDVPSKMDEDMLLLIMMIFCPIFILSKSPKVGTMNERLAFSLTGAPVFRKAKPALSAETNSALNFPLAWRRISTRCAPQPRSRPISEAMVRT